MEHLGKQNFKVGDLILFNGATKLDYHQNLGFVLSTKEILIEVWFFYIDFTVEYPNYLLKKI
jgi:hypothetical protein